MLSEIAHDNVFCGTSGVLGVGCINTRLSTGQTPLVLPQRIPPCVIDLHLVTRRTADRSATLAGACSHTVQAEEPVQLCTDLSSCVASDCPI